METSILVELAIVNAKQPLKALADVSLHWEGTELRIRRCAVFEKSGQPPWATLPRLSIQKNGMREFVPIIDLSKDLKKRVLEAVLAEYRSRNDLR